MTVKKHIYDWQDIEKMTTSPIIQMYNDPGDPTILLVLQEVDLFAIMMSNRTGIPNAHN